MYRGVINFVFNSGEKYQESHQMAASSPQAALGSLRKIAQARLQLLASCVQIVGLRVAGVPAERVSWRGAVATTKCLPWEVFNIRYQNGGDWIVTRLVGIPREIIDNTTWRLNAKGLAGLRQYARTLADCYCMIVRKGRHPVVVKEVQATGLATRKMKRKKRTKARTATE